MVPSLSERREVVLLEEKVGILIRRGSVTKQQRRSMDGQYRVYTSTVHRVNVLEVLQRANMTLVCFSDSVFRKQDTYGGALETTNSMIHVQPLAFSLLLSPKDFCPRKAMCFQNGIEQAHQI